jgi:threonine aldolase
VSDDAERFRTLSRECTSGVFWNPFRTPGEELATLAAACGELGINEPDIYGEWGAVARLEEQVGQLLGKPAVMFPSGVMAQQSMLRLWCERSGSMRVALPDLSHLLLHEDDGPRLVHGFRFEHLTTGATVPTAEAFTDLTGRLGHGLGAVLVELPLREAGCLLPTWEELTALSVATRGAGVPLHADGARIWESQPFYDRPLSEIVGLVDSIYVSFYKGLGGLSGACVAAPEDLVGELRTWRRRMGGTLYRLTPYAVSALVGLRDQLPRMAEYLAWARALAAELVTNGLTVSPDPPHTNTFQVFAPGDVEQINERLFAFMAREKRRLGYPWRASEVPGVAMCELPVAAAALAHDPVQVARWIASVAGD